MDWISQTLNQMGITGTRNFYIAKLIIPSIFLLIAFLGYWITNKALLIFTQTYQKNHDSVWAKIFVEKKLIQKLSHIVPVIFIFSFAEFFQSHQIWIHRIAMIYMVSVGVNVGFTVLNFINEIYATYNISKSKPIKGYIQIVKIFLFLTGSVIVLSTLINQSPLIILSGISALAAVFLLVFKDSLLGLVAGIQLAANDMVRLGDWIEMPKYGADGDVVEISLNTVKVKNFDLTIVTIPTYALISDSFKNWRNMHASGARRIKRAIYIDTASIGFCNEEMIERFKKIHYLKGYIDEKQKEIEEYNQQHLIEPSEIVNGRRLTNIGTFRAYIQSYLQNHPKIHKDFTQIVRQLPSGENGLPIEIYVYTVDTQWKKHEALQSDIFDHIFSVVPQFGLRVFQQPTGYDMRIGFGNKE